MPPITPTRFNSNSPIHHEPRFDATDYIDPRSRSGARAFVREVAHSADRFLHRNFGDARSSVDSGQGRVTGRMLYGQGRKLEADFYNLRERFSNFVATQKFKDAIDRRDFQGARYLWSQHGVSFQYRSSIGAETWGHRIARLDPRSIPARQIMWLVLTARDGGNHQVNLGLGDEKGRTPAHVGAARNNREFFDLLIEVARRDPLRDLGIDAVDYKGRTCEQMTSQPGVLAQIREIRLIQAHARAQLQQQQHQQQQELQRVQREQRTERFTSTDPFEGPQHPSRQSPFRSPTRVDPQPSTHYQTQLFVHPAVNSTFSRAVHVRLQRED